MVKESFYNPTAVHPKQTITDEAVEVFTQYRRSQVAELRPWQPGDDVSGVSVSAEDAKAGSPKSGDMIARNPKNHADQWLVAAAYFADNFEPLAALPHLSQGAVTPSAILSQIALWSDDEGLELSMGQGDDLSRRILSAISPAPVGVATKDAELVATLRQYADYRTTADDMSKAMYLAADRLEALASHEPAPADTQEGMSEAGEVVAYGEVLSGKVETVRIDKSRHCTEPLVRQSDLTACQQEVERLREEKRDAYHNGYASRDGVVNACRTRAETAEARILELEADLEVANDKVERLRKLDQEYGRVEMAIIMSDPAFDGDGPHDNCGDRLIASVRNLKNRAEAAEARNADLEKALEKISRGTYDGIEVAQSHSARDLRNIARAALSQNGEEG